MDGDPGKAPLRERLIAARRAMAPDARRVAGEAIAAHADAEPTFARARRVAVYLSLPTEVPTSALIDGWWRRGTEVLVPVIRPEHRLDWVRLERDASTAVGPLGIPEPAGPGLGADAVATCDLVVVPALAVDHAGHRLGRGAGYYDRALADVAAPVCAVVFTDELLPEVPHEPHDVPVQLALTPGGLFRVAP